MNFKGVYLKIAIQIDTWGPSVDLIGVVNDFPNKAGSGEACSALLPATSVRLPSNI
jgi:hypothetical protein